jgi:hypothetical protein
MIRFDCIKKKIIRQREENDDSNTTGVRITARSDVAFVLDGVRQEEVEEKVDGDSSDDESVDSATNFDIITAPETEAVDEETYEDLNESCYGFFHLRFLRKMLDKYTILIGRSLVRSTQFIWRTFPEVGVKRFHL